MASQSLCDAVSQNDVAQVKLLLSQGANVHEESKQHHGWVPLHYAASHGSVPIVKLLLASGADVHKGDLRGGDTPLHKAAYNGHHEVAELLLAKGAQVDAKGELGSTPLHRAAIGGHLSLAKLLITKGANVNAADNAGRTPLYFAIGYEVKEQMAKWLLAQGADPNLVPPGGLTLYQLASRSGHHELAELLKNYKASKKWWKPWT